MGLLGQHADKNILGDLVEEPLTEQNRALAVGIDKNPDAHATELNLAQKTGLPVDTVQRNKATIERENLLKSIDADKLYADVPEAREWGADPDNIALVSDHLKGGNADYFTGYKRLFRDLPRSYDAGKDTLEQGDLEFRRMFGQELTPEENARADELYSKLQNNRFGDGSLVSDALTGTAQMLAPIGRQIVAGGAGAAAGAAVAGGGTALVTKNPAASLQAARIGATYGGGASSVFENFKQQSGQIYGDIRRIKDTTGGEVDQDTARGAAIVVGLANAGLDTVALGKILETFPAGAQIKQALTRQGVKQALANGTLKQAFSRIGQRFATGVTAEGLTEAMQEATQIMGEEFTKGQSNGDFEDFNVEQAVSRTIEAGKQGVLVGGTLGGAGSIASATGEVAFRKRANPQEVAAQVQAIDQAAKTDPLLKRSPERAHKLFQSIAKDEKFYIDADVASDALANLPEAQLEALFKAVPTLEADLNNSMSTGADLSIGKADYAAFIAPYNEIDLSQHLKLDPNDISMSEQTARADFTAKNPELATLLEGTANTIPDLTVEKEAKVVERYVKNALVQAGRSINEARALSKLFGAPSFINRARAVGLDPIQYFTQQNNLSFTTVDDNNNVVKQGSVMDNVLADLQGIQSGKARNLDEPTRAALQDFATRLTEAGITTEQARAMSPADLTNAIYGDAEMNAQAQRLNQSPIDEIAQNIGDAVDAALGVQPAPDYRPVLEKYIAEQSGDITQTQAFKDWFGDSKIVDADGKPLVVYHGSKSVIGDNFEFSVDKIGTANDDGFFGRGFYLTSDKRMAETYAFSGGKERPENLVSAYVSMKNPFIYNDDNAASLERTNARLKEAGVTVEAKSGGVGAKNSKAFTDQLKAAGYDGVIVTWDDDATYINQLIAFDPAQIKSVNNRGTFDQNDPRILYQKVTKQSSVSGEDLMVIHNLSDRNLQNAAGIGGLPVPSLAVTRTDIPFDSFGDITLIAPSSMADYKAGKENKVYDADVYSPRYPRPTYLLDRKAFTDLEKEIAAALPDGMRADYFIDQSAINDRGVDGIADQGGIALLYLKEVGAPIPETDLSRDGTPYESGTGRRYKIAAEALEGYQDFVEAIGRDIISKEQIFDGFTNSGNRRYLPHDLDTVTRIMKRTLKDGEGFNYGIPSVRAGLAKQYRSLSAIKEDQNRLITSEEMDAVKDEIEKDYNTLYERVSEKVKNKGNVFSRMDNFTEHLKEVGPSMRLNALDEYYDGLTAEDKAAVRDFLMKLANAPTQYFEVKVQRAVRLNEFQGAIISDKTSKRSREILEKNGIPVAEYKSGDKADRARVMKEFTKSLNEQGKQTLFQDARGWIDFDKGLRNVVVAFTNRANFTTGAHEFSHWATQVHRTLVQAARERKAAGDENPELDRIIADWEALRDKVGATSDYFDVEQEEKIASMFEAYMRDGNGPSEGLRRAFAQFRNWFMKVYQDLSKLGYDLDDETRGIFDRWLASDDAINSIKEKNGIIEATARELGLDGNVLTKISDYVSGAINMAEEKLFRELRSEDRKRKGKEYQDQFDRMRKDVEAEFKQKREYAIVDHLDRNAQKIYLGNYAKKIGELPEYLSEGAPDEGSPITLGDIDQIEKEIAAGYDREAAISSMVSFFSKKAPKKPMGILDFIASKGGMIDEGGELANMGLTRKSKPSIVAKSKIDGLTGRISGNSKNMPDSIREAAVEAGFLKDTAYEGGVATTTANDLYDAIREEMAGNLVTPYADEYSLYKMYEDAASNIEEEASMMGIDIGEELQKSKKLGAYAHLFSFNTTDEGLVLPDELAETFGYDTGDEMVKELRKTKNFDNAVDRETRERLKKDFPDMSKDGRITEEATNAMYNDRTLLALDTMIKEISKQTGKAQTNLRQFAKVIAQDQLAKMKIGDTGYAFRWDAARDKEMKNALQFARQKNPEKALLSLQKAMVNHMLYKNLLDFNEQKAKAFELFKRVNMKDKKLAPTTDIDFIGAARYILSKFGLSKEPFDIAAWMREIQDRDPSLQQDLIGLSRMVATPDKDFRELSVAEFRDVYDSVNNIFWVARSTRKIDLKGKEIDLQKVKADLVGQLSTLPQKTRNNLTASAGDRLSMWVNSAKSSGRRIEHWINSVDGGPSGFHRTYILNPVFEASNKYMDERPKWFQEFRNIIKGNQAHIEKRGKIEASELRSPAFDGSFRDRLELIGFLMHTGNESNLNKLLGGYQIERANWDKFLVRAYKDKVITDTDMKIVQNLWDLADRLKPMAQSAHKQLYGFKFDEIQASPVTTPFGTYRGGYWPAVVDYTKVEDGAVRQAQDEATGINNSFMLPTTGKGFTFSRVDNYRRPLSVDLRLASSHIDKVLRFAILESPIRDARRITSDRTYREALQKVDEYAGRNLITPWLQRVARQETEAPVSEQWKFIEPTARFLNKSVSAQAMMFNLLNAVQNVTSLSNVVLKTGWGNFGNSFARYMMNPAKAGEAIRALSTEMRVRQNIEDDAIMAEINDIILRRNALMKGKNWAIKHGYVFQRVIQNFVDNIAWMSAYEQAQNEGKSQGDAISYADSIVRTTQGSTSAKDISSIEAGSAGAKLFLKFYSWFNNMSNLTGTDAQNIIRKSGFKGAPQLVYMYIMNVAVPLFVAEMLVKSFRGQLPEDDGEEGLLFQWLSWFGMSQVRGITASVPYVGQVANALLNGQNDNPLDDRISLSPVVNLLETTGRFINKGIVDPLTGGDGYTDDSKEIRDALTAIGFVTGTPIGQLGKPLGYLADVNEGDSDPEGVMDYAQGLIAGAPAKR